MKKFLLTSCAFFAFSADAQAATILTGYAQFGGGGQQGDRLAVGGGGGATADGSAIINDGTVIILGSGTSPDELVARPKIDAGEGGFEGSILLSGTGTQVILDGTNSGSKLEIGDPGGVGTFEITDGAQLIMNGGPSSENDSDQASNVYLQFGFGGDGTLKVANGGSVVTNGDSRMNMMFGDGGTGELLVDGGTINMTSTGTIAEEDYLDIGIGWRSTGVAGGTVTGGSTIEVTGSNTEPTLHVGQQGGDGTLVVSEGSSMSFDGLRTGLNIGDNGGNGTVTVTGSSTLSFTGSGGAFANVGVGDGAFGQLTIEDGSSVSVTSNDPFNGTVRLGANGGTSVVEVESGGSFSTTQNVDMGPFSGPDGTASLLSLNGGTVEAREFRVNHGAAIVGTGDIIGDVILSLGGSIGPGLSPGVLEITGDLLLGGGTLDFEVAGTEAGMFDQLLVSGAILASSSFDLAISFIDGFTPADGQVFNLFSSGTGITGFDEFASISFLGAGVSEYSVLLENGSVALRIDSTVAPVPLPAGLPLALSGFVALWIFRRRSFT